MCLTSAFVEVKIASHLREVHLTKTGEYDSLAKDADRLAGDYQRQVEYLEEELTTKDENLRHRVMPITTSRRALIFTLL